MGPMPLRTASSPHLGSGGTLLNVPGPPSGPPDAQALHHPMLSCHPLTVGPQRALPAGGPQPGARSQVRHWEQGLLRRWLELLLGLGCGRVQR